MFRLSFHSKAARSPVRPAPRPGLPAGGTGRFHTGKPAMADPFHLFSS